MGSLVRIECPACHLEGMLSSFVTVDVAYFGEVVITTLRCPNCGMKGTDVLPVTSRGPARYTLKVSGPSDLDVRVVRSSTSRVSIPEIGLTIEPGPSLDGYVTNVEGLLRRVIGVVRTLERDLGNEPEKRERALSLLKLLERSVAGRMEEGESFTIVLEDPLGAGLLASEDDRALFTLLTDEEAAAILRKRTDGN